MKEIEVLVEIVDESLNTVQNKLKGLNFITDKKVKDVYFYDPLRTELKPKEETQLSNSFRLRIKNQEYYMAYKVDHFDGKKWIYSDEHEVKVDDFDTALEIVFLLGLKELVVIDNTKYTYLTDEYEIVLEDVKDLGLFLEVEYLHNAERNDVGEIKNEINRFIKSLGIKTTEELNLGKPELMLKRKGSRL